MDYRLTAQGLSWTPEKNDQQTKQASFVLKNINLKLKKGNILAITGPSGSGKSTLLKLLAKFIPLQTGSIRLDDVDSLEIPTPQWRRAMPLVFQKTTLIGPKVRDDIKLGFNFEYHPTPQKLANYQMLSREYLQQFQLPPEILEKPSKQLSGGEAQRIALIRALLTAPKVLLLDEPTANLDPRSKEIVKECLIEVSRSGTSIIWISHDWGFISKIAQEGIELTKGEISREW